MSDLERKFHETWLGMVQPTEGLVVSIPVLIDAQCMERQPTEAQARLLASCTNGRIRDLASFMEQVLGFTPEMFHQAAQVPEALSLYVPEGKQTITPSMALLAQESGAAPPKAAPADVSPYAMLVWELPEGLPFDKAETATGTWDYPPAAKFERLLRHARVSIGLLSNGTSVRLVYAPHGESAGSITFRVVDMLQVSGRPIFDAFVMLLSANRFFGVLPGRELPALLAESRKRQGSVTSELSNQVFEALGVLLSGFQAASDRDGTDQLAQALEREGDHLYKGLLTVLLRLVFLLYAEDRGLLPVSNDTYGTHLSVFRLFADLEEDHGAFPDSMSRRFGAWGRLVSLFRAVYLGVSHGDLRMPPRHGSLFEPHAYPFLEGWGPAGSAPIAQAEERAEVRLPTVDDETVYRVLDKLIVFQGQRLSYRALDVEQIGSVYEGLMGYGVLRLASEAVCIRGSRLWVTADEVLEVPAARRAKWLKETAGVSTAQAERLLEEIGAGAGAGAGARAIEALGKLGAKGALAGRPGQLVLQPGPERRRTSSHYTPRSLSAPIVRRTLEPLLAAMGSEPKSARILNLKVCDPAMGSGAFLVEACRFLADQVLAAWTREGALPAIAREHGEPLLHARRLVAQRCLYGVDKNDAAVELAKLSLWLVTLSKDLPFTFLDHSLRHGDSLVGLDFDQIRSFHWKPGKQLELATQELDSALADAIALRQQIGDLAFTDSTQDQRDKERLLWDSQDALNRVRLIGDLVIGAFFLHDKEKDREEERKRRLERVQEWLGAGGAPPDDLLAMQAELRARVPAFHWMVEFPEVFYAERPDPLDKDQVNRAAFMDAFVGNPPFMGKNGISEHGGPAYLPWLLAVHEGAHGNADLSAHFFRRTHHLLGAHGTIGLIATNTIAQGDTRATGLQYLADKAQIYEATESLMWPGEAAVSVSIVHLAIGSAINGVGERLLNGIAVPSINTQLLAGSERTNATRLSANAQLSFQGSVVLGMGFTLTPEERDALVKKNPKNAERIFPYLGGQEVNTSPTQSFDRYVIHFGPMPLEQAEEWPDLVAILREKVKPQRDELNDNADGRRRKQFWWQFGRETPALAEAIAPLKRCLVTGIVSKHLMFSSQPSGRVFSHKLYVFPFEQLSPLAVLQSRVHAGWTWLLSSTMKNDLNYSASDCFETFPFPQPDPRTVIPALEDIGQRLYDFRAKYMVDENVGLTITYNRLKDPAHADPRILQLRALHEEMDTLVLGAYGWQDLAVPPFCPKSEAETQALRTFESAIVDRLFALNARRAEEEKLAGLGKGPGKKKPAAAKPAEKKPRAKKKEQLGLGGLGGEE